MRSASTWPGRRYWAALTTPPTRPPPLELHDPFSALAAVRATHPAADSGILIRTNDAAPRPGGRTGPRRSRVRVPRAYEAVGVAHEGSHRARPRWHVPGALRAQRVRRGPAQAPRRSRSRG